jgi:hypothetical protein
VMHIVHRVNKRRILNYLSLSLCMSKSLLLFTIRFSEIFSVSGVCILRERIHQQLYRDTHTHRLKLLIFSCDIATRLNYVHIGNLSNATEPLGAR